MTLKIIHRIVVCVLASSLVCQVVLGKASCRPNSRSAFRPTLVLQDLRGGDSDWRYDYDRQGHDGYADAEQDYYGRDEEDDYYAKQPSSRGSSSMSNLPNVIRHGDRRIGIMLLGAGAAVTMLGVSLFFNKALMRLGNLLIIAGVPVTIGPSRTLGYFLQKEKMRATGCLLAGIFLVFVGWPIFGIILEAFGLLNLFGNMFPIVAAVARTMPGIGPLLNNNGRRKERRTYVDYDYRDDDRAAYGGEYYEDDSRGGQDDDYYGGNDSRYY